MPPSNKFYSVRIPEPVFPGELEQLAQFDTPDGIVCAYWHRPTKQVVLERNGEFTIQPDGNVVESIAELLSVRKASLINMTELFFFEKPGHGKLQDIATHSAFYECEWSDYACDRIAIQARLTYPYDD